MILNLKFEDNRDIQLLFGKYDENLKTIERGKSPTQVNLTSFNAKPINGVKLEWIGEICVTLPRGQIERLRAKAAVRARNSSSVRTARAST